MTEEGQNSASSRYVEILVSKDEKYGPREVQVEVLRESDSGSQTKSHGDRVVTIEVLRDELRSER